MRTQMHGSPTRALTEAAGRHFVLFRLYQQGLAASLGPDESRGVDLVVIAPDDGSAATVQVRTRARGSENGWTIKAPIWGAHASPSFFAFVDLDMPRGVMPVTYIVPSRVVADMLAATRRSKRVQPGHRDNRVRRVTAKHRFEVPGFPDGWMEPYREAWASLRSVVVHRQEPITNGEVGGTTYVPALLPTPPPG